MKYQTISINPAVAQWAKTESSRRGLKLMSLTERALKAYIGLGLDRDRQADEAIKKIDREITGCHHTQTGRKLNRQAGYSAADRSKRLIETGRFPV